MLVLARSWRASRTEGSSGARAFCGAAWSGVSATSFSGLLRRKRNWGGSERQGKESGGVRRELRHLTAQEQARCEVGFFERRNGWRHLRCGKIGELYL